MFVCRDSNPGSSQQVARSPPTGRSPKMGRRALQRSPNKNINASPPDYNSVRGLPPLPPLPPPPGSPPSLAIATSSSAKGLDRVLLERNLEKLLSERGSNHSSSSEHLPMEGDFSRILGLSDCSGHLCLESHIEKLVLKEDAGKESNLNFSRLVMSGSTGDVKPDIKKLFLDIDNCDSGNSEKRKDLRLVLGDRQDSERCQVKKLNVEEIQDVSPVVKENRHVDAIRNPEPSTSLDWRPQLSDSPHDSGHASSMPELAIQPATPSSPQRKNVRFKGAPVELEERRLPRSRSYSGRPRHHNHDLDDAESYCSTCSSSSSSDDMSAYQLPPRRAYGGVRISYVPNDAFAIARQRQQSPHLRSPTRKTVDDKNCVIS